MSIKRAIFNTSMGTFKVDLMVKAMPITTSNFIDLANKQFYDGLHFHRVIKNFMIQFGCPNSRDPNSRIAGTGGPEPLTEFTLPDGSIAKRNAGGCIKDELKDKTRNSKGTISMANTGRADSGGSQFFINTVDNDYLNWFDNSTPSKHPVFGHVVDGMDVVNKIGNADADTQGKPTNPIVVESVKIEEIKLE